MIEQKYYKYCHDAIVHACGDDFERATFEFGDMTEEQLNQIYGNSDKTCRQVLAENRENRDLHESALKWFESICAARETIASLSRQRDILFDAMMEIAQAAATACNTPTDRKQIVDDR